LSNLSFAYFLALSQKAINPLAYFGISEDELTPLLVADARTLTATLDHIDHRYGTVERYLRDRAGLTSDIIERLRDLLLE
jgi:protein tyrosine/serine phosphatase